MESDFPKLSQKKAFLFDYGDTLVRYYKGSEFYPILKIAIQEISTFLNEHQIPTKSFRSIWKRAIKENYESPNYRVRPLNNRLQHIFQFSSTNNQLMDNIQAIFTNAIHSVAKIFNDSISTLKKLKLVSNCKIVIVSNTPWGTPAEYWLEELKRFKIDISQNYIDFIAFCVDVGWRKPAAPIFRYVMNTLYLNAEECVFIGDNPKWDIIGPQKLGMDAILLDRNNEYSHLSIPSIRNLDDLFQFF